MRNCSVILILVLCPFVAYAQVSPAEKILLPVLLPQPVSGAYGSVWLTQTTFLNRGQEPLFITQVFPCSGTPCFEGALLSGQTLQITPRTSYAFPHRIGKFLGIPRDREGDLQIDLRIFDTSRQSISWGAQVPVVPESTAKTGAVDLLAVPTAEPFRALLRIYDFDPNDAHRATVKIYRIATSGVTPDELLSTMEVQLQSWPANDTPGYAEINLSAAWAHERAVRIQITPATVGLRFWAMASITNNETQQVTLVTP